MKNLVFTLLLTLASIIALGQKNGLEIMRLVDEQANLADEYQEMQMSQINSKGKKMDRLLKMYVKRNEGLRKSLIVFTSPADIKGSAFLTIENQEREDDNLLYLPILRRSRRISSSDKTDKFMGSDFTYEDLEEEDLSDFAYEYLGDETINGKDVYKVVAKPSTESKKKETGYNKRIIYIDKASHLMVKILYFDRNDVHTKTYEAVNIQQLVETDKFRSYSMKMTDLVKNHVTELTFSSIKAGNNFNDALFSKRTLENGI